MVQPLSPETLIAEIMKNPFVACSNIHDHPCLMSAILRLIQNIRSAAKIFIPLYFVPTLIMKRKLLKTQAGPILKGTLENCLRTIGFVSVWWAIWKYGLCKTKDFRHVVDGWNSLITGFISGLAILFENEGKASIISLLMLPRLLETTWNFLIKRGFATNSMPVAGVLFYGLVMGCLNFFYQNNEGVINSSYLKVFKGIWGIN